MEKPLLVTDFLDRARKYYGDMEAIVATTDESFTYDEFGDRVDRLSTMLQEHGIEKGDRVAVLDPNTHYHLETAYATMQLGGVHTPLNYRLTPDDFEYILNDAGVDAIYADYEYARKVEAVRDEIPTELYAEQAQYHGVHAVDTRRHSVTPSTDNCIPKFPTHTFKC